MKLLIISLILLSMTASLFFCNIRVLTYITVTSIFFPIYIPIMGRDAMSTGTACIFLLFLKYLARCFQERRFIKEKADLFVYSLMMLGALSIMFPMLRGELGGMLIGTAIRKLFAFFAAMLLFVVIKNGIDDSLQSNYESNADHVEKLLSLFLLFVSVHILISISLKFFPSIAPAFSIFYERNITDIVEFSRGNTYDMERAWTFVMSPESYGELLAALTPIVLYKIFKFSISRWFLCLLLFGYGQILAVTRSGILLCLFGVTLSLLYYSNKKFTKVFACVFIFLIVFSILIYSHPSLFENVFSRFGEAAGTYRSSGNLLKTIHRSEVFVPALRLTVSNVSFVGNGLSPFHFHNLFLTTLHEKGVVGATLFFVVLLYPLVRLIKSVKIATSFDKALIFSCLLCIVLFLINETKYEFTRQASYQQICWGVLGTCYLVAKVPSLRRG